jgi:integrase
VFFDRNTNASRENTNMPLSDTKLRSLKPKEAPYKVSDGEGLYVLVTAGGSRLWNLSYRFLGKQKTLAIGKYPAVGLSEARRAREAAKRRLAGGVDPSAERKAERRRKVMANSSTFQAVADEWFHQNEERWVKSYRSRLRSRLDGDLLLHLGRRPIAEIEPLELLDALRRIEKRDAIEMAKRVMQMAGGIFRYGVATGRCARDITADLKGALKPSRPSKHRASLPAKDLPIFMAALDAYDGDIITKLAMKLLLLTFVRTSELRFSRWVEFEDLDGQNPLWRIPSERMKMRRDHLVPLSPQAVTVISDLKKKTGHREYLFPAPTKSGSISENTLLFAIYRMGYHRRATVHGFRSTASTILNEAQFNRDWIELQLAHFDGSVRGAYNSAEWLPKRREMMAWWADYLDKSRRPKLQVIAS